MALVIGAWGAWAAWQAWKVYGDLNVAVEKVEEIGLAAEAGDSARMQSALEDLREAGDTARDRTDGLGWTALTWLPVVGDDARGVRAVAEVVSDLGADGVEPMVQASDGLDGLAPRDARVDVDALVELRDPVAQASTALSAASARLAEEDPVGYVGRFKTKYRALAAVVRDADHALSSVDTALAVLPTMLGADRPRNHLLVFQNNAEIRATGGLPGAVTLATAQDGRVELARQVAGNSFEALQRPVGPLTRAEQQLYGSLLGTHMINANFTPDFPRTAELIKARWELAYPETIDSVLSLDPVALSYVLKATGPVTVRDVELTADNIVDELLHEVYLRYEDPAEQDEFFREVARTTFERISSGGGDVRALMSGLARGADEGRIFVHSFADVEQQALTGSDVAGEFITDPAADPQVTVTLNDLTMSKMSYFLDYDVSVTATHCGGGRQAYTGHMRIASSAPDDAASLPAYITGAGSSPADPGSQFVMIRLYSPAGGEVSGVKLDAMNIDDQAIDQDGRKIAEIQLALEPGQESNIRWTMKSGADQTGDTEIQVTPGVRAGAKSSVARSAC
ncbi:DUF4012 domain-containing protein [Nocardioides sp. dk4132]|uniref:DUF4012 domain-containing protein n=1 Tax=unclassified Nocardioides TaxID=2615069 RepID=UPI001294B6F2|nr:MULTISPECIES: DUF4012 domain-containing protein [unclassified Nocardioides]MQW78125.1 DUF4012 domain-containing protein [Nocardioides sp. dk4132]QGA09053.1 DUF4012 domain-containing protein [Nocardioides sp. dk884]